VKYVKEKYGFLWKHTIIRRSRVDCNGKEKIISICCSQIHASDGYNKCVGI
jgi:hypothetical protein